MDPTARDVGAPPDPDGTAPPRPLDLPWVDVHQHTGSLTWNDRERSI